MQLFFRTFQMIKLYVICILTLKKIGTKYLSDMPQIYESNKGYFTGFGLPYWTKFYQPKLLSDKIFRRTKFSTPSRNFDNVVRFLPDFCIEILDTMFD